MTTETGANVRGPALDRTARETLAKVRHELDRNHYGADRPKELIVDGLSVTLRRLACGRSAGSQCLVMVGPPGTGKTSMIASIGQALDIPVMNVPLAGISAPFELVGSSSGYTNAKEGLIAEARQRARSDHFLLVLDELDKLAVGGHNGNPYSALLPVIDPVQNHRFVDLYLGDEDPIDLSGVLFMATANTLDPIPEPLLNRMEVVEFDAYSEDERMQVLVQHLIPRALDFACFAPGDVVISPKILEQMVANDLDPGMRSLKRQVETIVRKAARELATSGRTGRLPVHVRPANAHLFGIDMHRTSVEAGRNLCAGSCVAPLRIRDGWLPATVQVAATGPGSGVTVTGVPSNLVSQACLLGLDVVRAAQRPELPSKVSTSEHHINIEMETDLVQRSLDTESGLSQGLAVPVAIALVSHWSQRHPAEGVLPAVGVDLFGRVLPLAEEPEIVAMAARHGLRTVLVAERPGVSSGRSYRRTRTIVVDSFDEVLDHALEPAPVSDEVSRLYL